jgi:hypothetical protein
LVHRRARPVSGRAPGQRHYGHGNHYHELFHHGTDVGPWQRHQPALGTTATTGDQAGTDTSGRPISPSLYITDITSDPNSLSGDWQYGGTAIAPAAIFGAWKGAVRTVNYTTGTPAVAVTCDADPAKNGSNLGTGADAPPVGVGGDGYSAEARWNLQDLYNQGLLIPGHN